jgi:predicted nucleic acid-binding protein
MLVDTSVWVDYFNGFPSREADRLAKALSDDEPIALPGVVWAEILFGLRSDSEAAKICGLLDAFDYVTEPTRLDYIESARIYRTCRTKGFTIRSTVDCVIARLCLRDQLPLLCKDRDFQVIRQFFPLILVEI